MITSTAVPRAPERSEQQALIRMIDLALRPGASLSAADDMPLLIHPGPGLDRLVVVDDDGALAAHAAARDLEIQGPEGERLVLAAIGGVCTRRDLRGRGHARALVDGLCDRALERGAVAAILWSEKHDFYAKLGFSPAGRETRCVVERSALPSPAGFAVRPLTPRDVPALVNLRLLDPMPIRRLYKDAKLLFAMPRTRTYVAVRDAAIVGYAVIGKGLDFPDIIHEWSGAQDVLPGLFRETLIAEGLAQTLVIGPSWSKDFAAAVLPVASHREEHAVGLVRPLDLPALRAYLPVDFAALEAPALVKAVFDELPFYVWGLDSV